MEQELFVDEETVVSMFFGELGWFLQRWQGYLRYLKNQDETLKDKKFILLTDSRNHVFVDDFIAYTIDLPPEFRGLNLETDCYEAPPSNSPPGSLTPKEVYTALIEYARNFYNVEKAFEIWPPRGCNLYIDRLPQTFKRYSPRERLKKDKPIITVFPRGRTRSPQRNVPEHVWREMVTRLQEKFYVCVAGTPGGSFLGDIQDSDTLTNLINYEEEDKTELVLDWIMSSITTISSQSGPTHMSLLCGMPTYIIGHERDRHCQFENRTNCPTSFRYVPDYRAIDAMTILNDVASFIGAMGNAGLLIDGILAKNAEGQPIGGPSINQPTNSLEEIIKRDSLKLRELMEQSAR